MPKPPWGKFAQGLPSAPWGGWFRDRLQRLRHWLVPPQSEGRQSDAFLWRLRLAERLCWVVLIALGSYLIIDLFLIQQRPPVAAVLSSGAGQESAGPSTGITTGQLKPLSEYQTALATRNPFGLQRRLEAQGPIEPSDTGIAGLTSGLVVVGLSRGRVPEALIEDTAAQRTHVVKVGDKVNGLTVKKIDAHGVVVSDGHDDAVIQ